MLSRGAIAAKESAAIDHQLIRQPAGLGTLPAIGTASSPGFAAETLPRIGNTQRPVDKRFQLDSRCRDNAANVLEIQFPAQHDSCATQGLGQVGSLGTGDGHLGATVDFQLRRNVPRQFGNTRILYDDGITTGFGNGDDCLLGKLQFVVKHECVERDESPHTSSTQLAHDFRQFAGSETNLGSG